MKRIKNFTKLEILLKFLMIINKKDIHQEKLINIIFMVVI